MYDQCARYGRQSSVRSTDNDYMFFHLNKLGKNREDSHRYRGPHIISRDAELLFCVLHKRDFALGPAPRLHLSSMSFGNIQPISKYSRRKLRIQQQRQDEHNTQRTQRNALEMKRSQWKAASARYYENHPEVRAKKRLKMAAQRAAKKLSRRKRDPPKMITGLPPQDHQLEMAVDVDVGRAASILNSDRADVHAAAESLLYLQRRITLNPFPEDLPPSDEIPTSEPIYHFASFLFRSKRHAQSSPTGCRRSEGSTRHTDVAGVRCTAPLLQESPKYEAPPNRRSEGSTRHTDVAGVRCTAPLLQESPKYEAPPNQ
ncbi:hypothetical protein C8R47DRAFT_1080253 [Mycena vitilis]|nr:hypothetical protein C8R47DRAFT_1080253 [Mycena vitilis]